nr:MAG TPA: hypothetical protein [Caudoviricetes sp.]
MWRFVLWGYCTMPTKLEKTSLSGTGMYSH